MPTNPIGDSLAFTQSGDFVYTVSKASASPYELVAVNIENQEVRHLPIASSEVKAGAGNTVVWFEAPNQLMSLDLAASPPSPVKLRTVVFPPLPAGAPSSIPRLIAAHGSTFLFSRLENGLTPGSSRIYLAEGSEDVRTIGSAKTDVPVGSAQFSPDGQYAAFGNYARQCANSIVGKIDIKARDIKYLDLPNPKPDIRSSITRLWWSASDLLMMSYSSRECFDAGQSDEWYKPSSWKLEGENWTQVEPGSVLQQITLSDGNSVRLVPNKAKSNDLVIIHGDNQNTLVSNAEYLAQRVVPQ
ncbi:hypothetical protein [Mycobacteroides saopaulense]|uniref:hypothetical protein n=1 Tax=Mycobacteroides saopaulense TaxID=1578165 RepID=UPI0012FFBC7E|nr:hypothetical protein [Mycobacteroides saopaulense]